jgi:uncharacterized membrane protein
MKQTVIERRRFFLEVWRELLRWALLIWLVASSISIVLCLHFVAPISVIMFFVEFLISFAVAWGFLFIRKPKSKQLVGDK